MTADSQRRRDLDRLYILLAELRERLGGYHYLRDCNGRMPWPKRGVYFLFEQGEMREDHRDPRVVRVGTHAVSAGSRTTLWNRLSQHRGTLGGSRSGGGNHRGSISRLHVGTALLNQRPGDFGQATSTWGHGANADGLTRTGELDLEREVSLYIGAMPLLWVAVDDEPGPTSDRHVIEANTIKLLSNAVGPAIDSPSPGWLGKYAARQAIRDSGVWNVDFVYGTYEPPSLDVLGAAIAHMAPHVSVNR